jgi:uncharacterized membrane protein YiaA
LAIAPVIVAIIALLKRAGLPVQYAVWANVVLALLFVGLIYLTGIYPGIQTPMTTGLNVLVMILTAAGFYDVQKNATERIRGTPSV